MNQTEFFQMLGAPLRNSRRSWGAVRPRDGAVFLRVWNDRMRMHEGASYVQVTHRSDYPANTPNAGFREREEHVSRIRRGAPSYFIFGEALDPTERPRKIKQYDFSKIYPGGRVATFDGEIWVEVLDGIAPRAAAAASGAET